MRQYLLLVGLLGPLAAGAQTIPQPRSADMSASVIQQQQAMLLAQCPPPPPRIPAAEAGPIHVTRWGQEGPRLVVIHGGVQGGLGGGPSTFAGQEALAQRGWRLELPDRPGFGSSPSRGPEDMEADSVWIADMLGDGAFLIGHSWGGAEALLAAARRPEAVRGLVLIEPALQSLLFGSPRIGADPALRASAEQFGGVIMAAKTPADYALGFGRVLGTADTGSTTPGTAMAGLQADPAAAARFGCSLLQARMASPPALRQAAERVAAAGIPTLVITGGWSPFFDAVGETAAELSHGRHLVVRSPNHFVQLAAADEFNQAVHAFLRGAERHGPKPASP